MLDSLGNDNGGLDMILSLIQLDQVEVAIVSSRNRGFLVNMGVSLLIGILKKVEAGPLPGCTFWNETGRFWLILFHKRRVML